MSYKRLLLDMFLAHGSKSQNKVKIVTFLEECHLEHVVFSKRMLEPVKMTPVQTMKGKDGQECEHGQAWNGSHRNH